MFRGFLAVLLMLNVLSSSGCWLAVGAAGVGVVEWVSDKIVEKIEVPQDKVVRSARSVLADEHVTINEEVKNTELVRLSGKYRDGRQVWVEIRPTSTNITEIGVRVGWVNGAKEARGLLNQIVDKSKSLF